MMNNFVHYKLVRAYYKSILHFNIVGSYEFDSFQDFIKVLFRYGFCQRLIKQKLQLSRLLPIEVISGDHYYLEVLRELSLALHLSELSRALHPSHEGHGIVKEDEGVRLIRNWFIKLLEGG